ncbi:MAG TPA: hypothetical protein VNN20_11295 [Thermodesulfobacteriota bacterium]|jgi:hypothetical protein|nr:hypothetical protein [Thermodesulfobacteriota bacterium]
MDLLISMKAETILKGLELGCNIMQMPTAQTGGYFIAEIREADEDKLKLLQDYAKILEDKLTGNSEFRVEHTRFGFILKKRVDQDIEYSEAWEKWVGFSRHLYEELSDFIDDHTG